MVFVTHALDEALRLGDRIAILKDWRIAQVGSPAEVLHSPADAYVRAFVANANRARLLPVTPNPDVAGPAAGTAS